MMPSGNDRLRALSLREARRFLADRDAAGLAMTPCDVLIGYLEDESPRGLVGLGASSELRCGDPAGIEALSHFALDALEGQELWCPEAAGPIVLRGWRDRVTDASRVRVQRVLRLGLSRGALAAPGPGELAIRRATRDDIGALMHLMCAASVELQGRSLEADASAALQAELDASIEQGLEYVGDVDGEVGFSASVMVTLGEAIKVENVFTAPSLRGQGLGTRGVHALCVRLLSERERVFVEVEEENEQALRLYRRLGFEFVERLWVIYK